MKRPDRLAALAPFVARACLSKRVFRIEMREGLHLFLDRSDAIEASTRNILRRDDTLGYLGCRLRRGQRC